MLRVESSWDVYSVDKEIQVRDWDLELDRIEFIRLFSFLVKEDSNSVPLIREYVYIYIRKKDMIGILEFDRAEFVRVLLR